MILGFTSDLFYLNFTVHHPSQWSISENSKENWRRKAIEKWETFYWLSCQLAGINILGETICVYNFYLLKKSKTSIFDRKIT